MKFDINDYKGKYVMHCKTEEEAREFVAYLKTTGWDHDWSLACYYGANLCHFNEGMWGSIKFAIDHDYTILEWSDFMNKEFTKADLRTGDVVMQRNGVIQIANRELGMFITEDWWNDMDGFNSNLTHIDGEEFDIIAVRRPRKKTDCTFKAFEYKSGTLVYERKEVEEMTLAEVCRLLGKEIKIVK